MKKSLQVLFLLAFGLLSSCTNKGADSASVAGYKLVWSDEFEGTSLNADYWTPMVGNGAQYGVSDWGNHELENYQAENLSVADGVLTITTKREETLIGSKTYNYTSGRLRTYQKESFTYGRIEARMKLPGIKGTWPAFWMLPEKGSWPRDGEIDIMENKGSDSYGSSGALHYMDSTGNHTYTTAYHSISRRNSEEPITSWHVYALEWDEETINYYVDEANFLSIPRRTWNPSNSPIYGGNSDAPFNKPFHILLNVAVGGDFDNGAEPPSTFVSCTTEVDYVRVYDFA
jgi:beta-glucanase (GH16 family)